MLSLRGGSDGRDASDSEYDTSDSECDEESSDIDEEEEEEEEEEHEDGGESDMAEEEEDEKESPASSLPVKITLKTSLSNNVLIDQSIELTASPTRTVQSLKQSVSRQFKSRPPMDAVVLRLDGQVLHDDFLVRDLVDEEDDEDEDDDGEDDLAKLTIIVDMVPPVDPKFGTEMKERLDNMTNEEVLDAYIANLASMHQNALDLMQPAIPRIDILEEEDENEDNEETFSPEPVTKTSLALQQYALMLKEQITKSLSEREIELLEKTDTPSSPQEDDLDSYEGDLLLKESIKRKKRRGGATANVKRALQKNLNINWPDTIRNFLLFLFFGYFGGRNAMSRTIMLLGAPSCFIIQARPVKVAIKQLFYTIGEPPGILLSLLPAPQQAIMSCDYDMALKGVYGDDIDQCNDLINTGRERRENKDEDNSDDNFDESYDEYDEDY